MQKVNEMVSVNMGNYLTNYKSWNPVAYNVLEYGLKGGGGVDDTQALQKLIDLAISEGRKAIYFPAGEYKVTSLTNADQVVFFGDNASFTGGYTGTIYQMGDWATNEQLADIEISVKSYGAEGDGTSNDADAIRRAIAATPPGATLSFPTCDAYYLVDGDSGPLFVIDKPMTIKGSKGGMIKLADQSTLWRQGGRTQLFLVTSSDVRFDGIWIDGNSRNNYAIEGNKQIFYAVSGDSIYPTGITSIEYVASSDSMITGAVVENCEFDDSSGSTVTMSGAFGVGDSAVTPHDRLGVVLNPVIRNNHVTKGQRSIFNFTGGVIGGVMRGNTGRNTYYTMCRSYIQTVDCVIKDNTLYIDTTTDDGGTYQSVTNGVPLLPVNCGFTAGHSTLGYGTVNNPTIENNVIFANGDAEWRLVQAIQIQPYVNNYVVRNNTIFGPTLPWGITLAELAKAGQVENNIIIDTRTGGITLQQITDRLTIRKNIIRKTSGSFTRAIEIGVSCANLAINGNEIYDDGSSGSAIWCNANFATSYLTENYRNNVPIDISHITNANSALGVVVSNHENYTIGQGKREGSAWLSRFVGTVTTSATHFYIVLEEFSSSISGGFTYGTIYGHRSDTSGREFEVDIRSHSTGGSTHIAHISYISGERSTAKLVKLTYGGKTYLAVKIGDSLSNYPQLFGVYFSGHHVSTSPSIFIVPSTATYTESPYTDTPTNGWRYGGRPGDAIGNNRALYVSGTGDAIEVEIDANGFVKAVL